jgi:3',5'-cyclic AMP phosphodiesterase CpdA
MTDFDLLLLLGDNVYWSGKPGGFEEKLYRPFRPLAVEQNVLIKGVLGNHDVFSKRGSELQMKFYNSVDATSQEKYFTQPVSNHKSFHEKADRYYSFTRKGDLVEFFALDSSMLTRDCCWPFFWKRGFSEAERQTQIDWLRTALKRSVARWKIVFLHHPFYSSAEYHGERVGDNPRLPKEMKYLRDIIEPILKDNRVRIVLSGHDHLYERIKVKNGLQYFVSGAGAKLRKDDFEAEQLPDFHGCGNAATPSFMIFSVRPESINFWALGPNKKPFDWGEIK